MPGVSARTTAHIAGRVCLAAVEFAHEGSLTATSTCHLRRLPHGKPKQWRASRIPGRRHSGHGAGGTHEHNALVARILAILGHCAEECMSCSSDQRYWIEAFGRARLCDASVVCGKPLAPDHDRHAITNPVLAVEVLSPSSEGTDEGEKRIDFQSLSSLRAYVLVAQSARRVQVYRRNEHGRWSEAPEVHEEGAFAHPSIREPLTVEALYRGILDERGRSLLQ